MPLTPGVPTPTHSDSALSPHQSKTSAKENWNMAREFLDLLAIEIGSY